MPLALPACKAQLLPNPCPTREPRQLSHSLTPICSAQVLAEIGVNLDSQMVAAPGGRVAQAAAAPAEAVPQAMGAAVGGGGGGGGGSGGGAAGGGGGDSGLDDDLQARLDRLRKT